MHRIFQWIKTEFIAVALALLVLLTALPYVRGLGFYNDDWAFLSTYEGTYTHSLLRFIQKGWSPMEQMRPGKIVYQAVLFWLFGLNPLGYHVINSLMIALSVALLMLLLKRLGFSQTTSFAIAVVWGTLPHAATTRFWYAAFQIPASLCFCFITCLTELHAQESKHPWRWRVFAILSLIVSLLLYETSIALLLIVPLLAIRQAKQTGKLKKAEKIWLLSYPLCVAAIVLMKFKTTVRLNTGDPHTYAFWILTNISKMLSFQPTNGHEGFQLKEALRIALVSLGTRLPKHAYESATVVGPGFELFICGAVGILTFLLFRPLQNDPVLNGRDALKKIIVGFVLFLFGWAVFIGSSSVELTPTGIGNRTAAAAAIGTAFLFIGFTEAATLIFPARLRFIIFSLFVAVLVTMSSLVVLRISVDWRKAWTKEQVILSTIQTKFPKGFGGKSLILDGVCQYEGPASVFEATWDLSWALQVRYKDFSIDADVTTPNLEIRELDLRTSQYNEEKIYPYGNIILFRPAQGIAVTPENQQEANDYFRQWNPDRSSGCPSGRIGNGVDVFKD